MVIVGIVAGLIMLQPDFGSCMILVATSGLIIYAGGASMKHIMGSIGLLILGVALVWGAKTAIDSLSPQTEKAEIKQDYRQGRIEAFLDPEKDASGNGYHIMQSLIALGEGGTQGLGLVRASKSFTTFLILTLTLYFPSSVRSSASWEQPCSCCSICILSGEGF